MATFSSLQEIPQTLQKALQKLGFETMTPIQERAIPAVLANHDLLAQSKTGSGKTLAFALPLLTKLDLSSTKPQHLVITPTRELAEQVAKVFRALATHTPNLKVQTLYGGVPLRAQADALEKGTHILIGTPGRIEDHLGKGTLLLDNIKTLVLDEADRMLDMGFYDAIVKIASKMPKDKQTLLFSATFPAKIEQLSSSLLHDPVIIKVDTTQTAQKIEEVVHTVKKKNAALQQLIATHQPGSLLVFANTKADVIALTQMLEEQGHDVIALHGDLEQQERNEAVILFANGSRRIMVATDVASRGLDIQGIDMIINYDLPFDEEVYTHRIGRTGRADAVGKAISLYLSGSDKTAYVLERAQHLPLPEPKAHTPKQALRSSWETLCILGGKKTKLRAGDILGTFCKEIGIKNSMIGKITITENRSYVALSQDVIKEVCKALESTKIKKRKYKAWIL